MIPSASPPGGGLPPVPGAVSVVILQWNRADDTVRCLESLHRISYRPFNVIVVDNGSVPGEMDILRAWTQSRGLVDAGHNPWTAGSVVADGAGRGLPAIVLSANPHAGAPFSLTVIASASNLGFAAGNNRGIRSALQSHHPEFIWLLNNDTEATPDALGALVRALQAHERTAAAAQSVLVNAQDTTLIDSLGIGISAKGSTFDIGQGTLIDRHAFLSANVPIEIFGACAASALFRAACLSSVGGFEEKYFAVFEDADLAFRLQLAGWRAVVVPGSVVYHRRGVSGARAKEGDSRRMRFLKLRNALMLKVRFWPFRLLMFRSHLLRVSAKVLLGSLRDQSVRQTALWLLSSARLRAGTHAARSAIFSRWAGTACGNALPDDR